MSRTYNSGEEAVGETDRPQSFWDEAIANVGFTRDQARCGSHMNLLLRLDTA